MRKIIWLIVSLLSVVSLLLASCAPAPATTTAPTTAPITAAPTTAPTATTPPAAEKPKYGGTINYVMMNDTVGFDQVYQAFTWGQNAGQNIVYDRLMVGDWAMGPAGTNQVDFSTGGFNPESIWREAGAVAESWEVPDSQTIIFKIRQGVYFGNPPTEAGRLVNGRQVDANDVVFSINYMYKNPKNPIAYNVVEAPGGKKLISATANDKWTVTVKVEDYSWAFIEDLGEKGVHIIPHELIDKYGDLKDWHNAVGSGGFFLTDYVVGSAFTFKRNPNFWMKNPVGPGKGDQLPYVDAVKILIIVDKTTALAAFRTGQADTTHTGGPAGAAISYDDVKLATKNNPELQVKHIRSAMEYLGVRFTTKDPLGKPLLDQKVRWALNMAINRESIYHDLYEDKVTPYLHFFPDNSPYFTAPADMPKILEAPPFNMKPEDAAMVKKMFEYHPDEAKKLLAEAGYPNGFKTQLTMASQHENFAALMKDQLSKVNVDLALDVREYAVWQSVMNTHEYPAFNYYTQGSLSTNPAKWIYYGPGDPTLPFNRSNMHEISDPVLDKLIQDSLKVYGFKPEEHAKIMQQAEAYLTWKAPWVIVARPWSYIMWWPWLKNYHGAVAIGMKGNHNFTYWAWIDQDLKKSMGK